MGRAEPGGKTRNPRVMRRGHNPALVSTRCGISNEVQARKNVILSLVISVAQWGHRGSTPLLVLPVNGLASYCGA